MSNKLFAVLISAGLLVGGFWLGQHLATNSPVALVGDADRYTSNAAARITAGTALDASVGASGTGTTIDVFNGESIQAAVKRASSGDIIRVYPGTYQETVYIDKDDIWLTGVIQRGHWPILEGNHTLNDAILYSGNNITVENFRITHYKGNAIMGQAGNNFLIRNNHVIDTGVYGIFPQLGKNGLIERNILSGIEDAAIYVGMCDNIHVNNNEVFENVAGIEIENTRHAIVENNKVYNNTGGILAFITPGLPIKTTYDVIIRNNFISDNNHVNFGAPGSIVAGVPSGSGIVVMAADQVTIEGNIITNNKNVGIVITDHQSFANISLDPESDPNSDQVAILNNVMFNNGYQPINEISALKLVNLIKNDVDIVNVGTSADSCILDPGKYVTLGLDDYGRCNFSDTHGTVSYLLPEPAEPHPFTDTEKGKMAYYGICTGCHAYNVRMIGPPVQIIQALYMDNPEGLADYIAKPIKKREDYPEMPAQNYLSPELRLAVAKFMLGVDNQGQFNDPALNQNP
ncbi:parallel beta-helix domain-containing protein [Simiduia aestuariiviva]|uniref:Parallel beta-helix repeat protein n=1 Tax=Simiduia aestuariiviva TaxID=1510459 RepID=A0A839UM06_9GAMM|nr:parallel beta-helix domain-containing protein [Simiduia aestuariiviva]MBB3167579.1 parallel beta-helix repeat protein [Simiduia aestuariiviva]